MIAEEALTARTSPPPLHSGLQAAPRAEASASRPRRARRGQEAAKTSSTANHPLSAVALRKSTDLVIMVMPDKLAKVSLIQRRAVNILLSVAQRIDRSGEGSQAGMYSIPLSTLEHDLGFNDDTNRRYIVDLIRKIAGLRFELGDGQHFHVGSLIAEIEVCFKTKMMRYSLPVGMKQKLLHPERFNYLKLVLLNHFTSHSSLMLYELACGYATHPAKRTPAYPWQQLSTWLTGSPTPHATYREFSKLLGRAIDQVNQIWPSHSITLMYTKSGRATDSVWFTINEKRQGTLALEHHPTVLSSRLASATARFSLRSSDIEELLTQYDEDYLLSQCDLVNRRIEAAAPGSIASPRAYFLKAVSENWADVPRESPPEGVTASCPSPSHTRAPASRPPMSIDEARRVWWNRKNSVIRARLAAMAPEELTEVVASVADAMAQGNATIYETFKRHGLTKPTSLAAVITILARREFEDPSDSEIRSVIAEAFHA